MKCANVAFSVVPRIGAGDAENWNRVWDQYGLLFWHTFGTVCCYYYYYFFFFFSLGFTFNTLHAAESDRPINIVFVRPYVRPFFRLYMYLLDTLWIARYNCHVNQRKRQTNRSIYRYCSELIQSSEHNGKCYYWYCILCWYTWLSAVCLANTCKDFMSTQGGLSLLWIYLIFCRFCCAPAHLQLWCTML